MLRKGEIREFQTELVYGVIPYVALVIALNENHLYPRSSI